jgi:hypothetical protein
LILPCEFGTTPGMKNVGLADEGRGDCHRRNVC